MESFIKLVATKWQQISILRGGGGGGTCQNLYRDDHPTVDVFGVFFFMKKIYSTQNSLTMMLFTILLKLYNSKRIITIFLIFFLQSFFFKLLTPRPKHMYTHITL